MLARRRIRLLIGFVCFALVHAQEPPSSPIASAGFTAALSASFAGWDGNHDAILDPLEIDAALADPKITGDAAAALAVVKRIARSKAAIPLTLEGLSIAAACPKSKDRPYIPGMFAGARKRIANANRALFSDDAPGLQCLHQGTMGNCFSLAPLGAMLQRDAAQVRAMFRQNGDGTFDVKLGEKTMRVAAPTEAEIALSSSNESTGLWSNVYEKAAGMARNELRAEKDRVTTPLDAIARGGSAGTMLAFITGNPMERLTLNWAKDGKTTPDEAQSKLQELRVKLKAAFAERRCVTTGTAQPLIPGLRGNHAYAVIGFNETADEIRVWDPHGDAFTPKGAPDSATGFPRKDGICDIPLSVFVKQFAGLAFELPPRDAVR